MKIGILVTVIIVPFFLCVGPVFSGEVKLKSKDENSWEMYNPKDDFLGNLKKEKGRFIFYDKDAIILKPKGKNGWEMYNQQDEFLGTLIKDEKYFKFYDNQENYIGLITETKNLMPKEHRLRTTNITPKAAKLYLDVLEALEEIK